MAGEGSWTDRAVEAAKGIALTTGIVGAGLTAPVAGMQDPGLRDSVTNSAITTAVTVEDAITSIVDDLKEAEDAIDETDIDMEPTTSLMIDPSELGNLDSDTQETSPEADITESNVEIAFEDDLPDASELEGSLEDDLPDASELDSSLDVDVSDLDPDDSDVAGDVSPG